MDLIATTTTMNLLTIRRHTEYDVDTREVLISSVKKIIRMAYLERTKKKRRCDGEEKN